MENGIKTCENCVHSENITQEICGEVYPITYCNKHKQPTYMYCASANCCKDFEPKKVVDNGDKV